MGWAWRGSKLKARSTQALQGGIQRMSWLQVYDRTTPSQLTQLPSTLKPRGHSVSAYSALHLALRAEIIPAHLRPCPSQNNITTTFPPRTRHLKEPAPDLPYQSHQLYPAT